MRKNTHHRGFTLLELMIVVAILGILAAVAIVGYTKYVERSHKAEATSILADIRIKQEAYKSVFKRYATADPAEGQAIKWAPAGAPGLLGGLWSSTPADVARRWRQLGVIPDSELYFRYTFVAGPPGVDPPAPFDKAGIASDTSFWYAARAVEDLDGDKQYGGFDIYSGMTGMAELEESGSNYP